MNDHHVIQLNPGHFPYFNFHPIDYSAWYNLDRTILFRTGWLLVNAFQLWISIPPLKMNCLLTLDICFDTDAQFSTKQQQDCRSQQRFLMTHWSIQTSIAAWSRISAVQKLLSRKAWNDGRDRTWMYANFLLIQQPHSSYLSLFMSSPGFRTPQ